MLLFVNGNKISNGSKVTCKIQGAKINDAILLYHDGDWFILQNIKDGYSPRSMESILRYHGYKLAWCINRGTDYDVQSNGVKDLKLKAVLYKRVIENYDIRSVL